MTKLITTTEVEGQRWRIQIGACVRAATEELDRLHANKKAATKIENARFSNTRIQRFDPCSRLGIIWLPLDASLTFCNW
ncbi:MAG: hypothetical protein IPO74_05450 [Thermomonas sp.]|nr:hypothetical protein [Thermomonas sp.]